MVVELGKNRQDKTSAALASTTHLLKHDLPTVITTIITINNHSDNNNNNNQGRFAMVVVQWMQKELSGATHTHTMIKSGWMMMMPVIPTPFAGCNAIINERDGRGVAGRNVDQARPPKRERERERDTLVVI